MTTTFSVTSSSSSLNLAGKRQGSIPFTVSNTRNRQIRGRAIIVPLNGAESGWFQINGDQEREFGDVQTDDFLVEITVPPSVPAGGYAVRLDIAAVDNPDEDYTAGPVVSINVDTAPVEQRASSGYLATIIGTALGGLAGLVVGGVIALIVGVILTETADNIGDAIGAVLIAMLLLVPGPWIGAAVGSGMALRMRGYDRSRLTGVLVAVVFPIWAVSTIALLANITDGGSESDAVLLILGLAMPPLWVVVPALLSRFLALMLGRAQS